MTDGPLAAGFDAVTPEQWHERAENGKPRALQTEIDGDLHAAWLYTRADELAADPSGQPGAAPFVRGTRVGTPWDIRQERAETELKAVNAAILEDLEGGASSIGLRLTAPGAPREGGATVIGNLDDLDRALHGAYLDMAPVALDAGVLAPGAAAALIALFEQRGHALGEIEGSVRFDPIGAWAADGSITGTPQQAVATAGAFAAAVREIAPNVRTLAVDTGRYVDAGANATTELAVAITTGAAYLRACDTAGLAPSEAASRIEFTFAVGTDQFLEMAKLRAARRLWARVLEVSGVEPEQRRSPFYARTTRRMLATIDPWVNMLRGTTATFAAATGGADGITVDAFDTVVEPAHQPSSLGRRIARNTQLVLAEESSLYRVADPGGGSWYVESLTNEIAQAAWAQVQQIERDGGLISVLADGSLVERIGAQASARAADLATAKHLMTGVNAFPLLGDDGVEARAAIDAGQRPDGSAQDAELVTRLAALAPAERLRAAVDAAANGAAIADLNRAWGEPVTGTPLLQPVRDSEPFEQLRARAAALDPAPRVFLACVGPLAAHVNVATWAKGFFETAAITTVTGRPHDTPAQIASEFAADGAPVAAVCAPRDAEEQVVADVVAALRSAGAHEVLLVGAKPEAASAAGADGAVGRGIDIVTTLSALLDRLEAR